MATAWTYATLKAALLAFTEETGTEYTAAIDTIIPLAEDQVLRDLDLELFDTVATTNFTAGSALLTKPTGFLAARTIHYTNASTQETLLEPKSWEFIKDYWPDSTLGTSTPKFYTDYSDTQWYLAGKPTGTNVVTVRYIKRPTGLTSVNTTTWLGTNVGDLLFYSCLAVSEQYLKADERIPVWKQEYQARLRAALNELKPSQRNDYMPMTAIPTKEK